MKHEYRIREEGLPQRRSGMKFEYRVWCTKCPYMEKARTWAEAQSRGQRHVEKPY